MAHYIPLNNAPYAALIDYKEFVNLFQIRENYSHNPIYELCIYVHNLFENFLNFHLFLLELPFLLHLLRLMIHIKI